MAMKSWFHRSWVGPAENKSALSPSKFLGGGSVCVDDANAGRDDPSWLHSLAEQTDFYPIKASKVYPASQTITVLLSFARLVSVLVR
jgi:hypothetical protein